MTPEIDDDGFYSANTNSELNLDNYVKTVEDFPEDGISYKDITPMLENPEALRESVDQIVEKLEGREIDKIGGFDARGFLHGPLVAQEMDLPFFPIRKEGKLPREKISKSYGLEYGDDVLEMHKDSVEPGEYIALVDDVLATGGTMEAGIQMVEELDGEIAYTTTVIEIEDLDGREKLEDQDYEFCSLLQY